MTGLLGARAGCVMCTRKRREEKREEKRREEKEREGWFFKN